LFTSYTKFVGKQRKEIVEWVHYVRTKETGHTTFLFPLVADGMFFGSEEWECWNTYDEEMLRLSKKFPEILFVIEVQHENTDREKCYYRGGKMTKIPGKQVTIWCKVFDPKLLK